MDELKNAGQEQGQPIEVEKTTEVATPKGRAALRSRYAQMEPDTNWDEMDDDALADRVMSDWDEKDGKIKRHEENDKKLTELFDKNPQSASFLMGMANGEDFLTNLQKNFGSDIVEAMQNPDKLEEMKKANDEFLKKAAKDKELQQQWETNMEGTLDRLQQEQDEAGLSDDEVKNGMDALERVVGEYLEGNISTDTIRMFLKAQSHDADVANARHSGEVEGRNASINESLRKSRSNEDGMPSLGGQSSRGAEGLAFSRGSLRGGNTGSNIWAAGGGLKRNNYQ